MMAVILAVAGSARASPDGVSTHTAFWPGTICGVYPPLWTGRLWAGLSEPWSIKVMRPAAAQAIQMPRGPGDAAHAGPAPGIGGRLHDHVAGRVDLGQVLLAAAACGGIVGDYPDEAVSVGDIGAEPADHRSAW